MQKVLVRDLLTADHQRAAAAEKLQLLAGALSDCQGCALAGLGRTQVVYGTGDPAADLLFVGEGPGFNEDKQGEPFVGQAGRLLNELLGTIGLQRSQVYIANVVKCRPPGNRDPLPDEIAACRPHLLAQIEVIRPRVICTLGRFATKLLAQTEASMGAVRGKAKETTLAGVDVIVFPVFHPAAALYTPANKVLLAEDFLKLRRLLDRGRAALGARVEGGETSAATPEFPAATPEHSAATPEHSAATPEHSAGVREQLPLF